MPLTTRPPRTRVQQMRREGLETSNYPVLGYSTNVLNYHTADFGKRLFGIELEVASDKQIDNLAKKVYDIIKSDAILKDDGSIGTTERNADGTYKTWSGFEIVTRPMTYENQVAFWRTALPKLAKLVRSYEPESCGLHIHFSKRSVSALTLGKLLVFLNDPSNKSFIKNRIAKRYNTRWAKTKTVKLGKNILQSRDRYEMLNVTPAMTNEFRLFRGSTGKRFFASLEFASATIEFCEENSIRDITLPCFFAWLDKLPAKKFPELRRRVACEMR